MDVVIIRCGFTGSRVAERFLARGAHVTATARNLESLAGLAKLGARLVRWDAASPQEIEIVEGALVLHSVPTLQTGTSLSDPTPALLSALRNQPSRMVYLSTTGIYGEVREVDE